MLKSVILPGWGQVVNRHVWKVPIIYATLGGLVAYSIFLHKRYHDYRAAFYNRFSENTDQRFGSTPLWGNRLQPYASTEINSETGATVPICLSVWRMV